MKAVFPKELHSSEELGLLIIEFRDYLGKLHDRSVRKKVVGTAHEALPELSVLASKTLQANDISSTKMVAIEGLLRDLEAIRDKAPAAHITLVELPDHTIKEQLVKWFRSSIDPHLLVSFTGRSDIGGGMILQAGSRRYDFTFRTQLLENKAHLIGVLARD